MDVLIIGRHGQLAWELQRSAPPQFNLTATSSAELDISDRGAVFTAIKSRQPQLVINCAAYTAVDKAESDQEAAYAVNHRGAENLAMACAESDIRLIHVSTDFVFDGTKSTPYAPADVPSPLGVYGASKLAGETSVRSHLTDNSVIVRTAWVYSSHGNNFVKTMLRLMAEKPQLGIVYDQVGTPTWAKGLAAWIWAVAPKTEVTGTFHWTDAGVASWYDFAVAIQECALHKGILTQCIPIRPIPAVSYPTPAKRPAYSVLDKLSAEEASGIQTEHWREQLNKMLDEIVYEH